MVAARKKVPAKSALQMVREKAERDFDFVNKTKHPRKKIAREVRESTGGGPMFSGEELVKEEARKEYERRMIDSLKGLMDMIYDQESGKKAPPAKGWIDDLAEKEKLTREYKSLKDEFLNGVQKKKGPRKKPAVKNPVAEKPRNPAALPHDIPVPKPLDFSKKLK